MIPRTLGSLALGLALVGLVALGVLGSGSDRYLIRLRLADADGLRQGSPVAIAGQDVGTVSLGVRGGQVTVALRIDRADAPVGRDATAEVSAVNLLGQKRVELTRGDPRDPAPSGYLLPSGRVTVSTDLDQVLDVLTPDTRARLAILIDAAGQALTGRRADFSQVLAQLPPDLGAGTTLLHGIAGDNHTLADLVQTSDGFVSELAAQHAALTRAIGTVGQTAATLAARRAALAATLARAPGTLAVLRGFLARLRATTVPLGPAARDLITTAPALEATLTRLEPFRVAAGPTLRQATAVAPELTRLAVGATPVLVRATPVAAALATFSADLQPISAMLGRSVDNTLATVQNWSRAIQLRDGLSHVFRGEATISPETFVNMLSELPAPAAGKRRARAGRSAPPASRVRSVPRPPATPAGAGRQAGTTATTSPATTPTTTTPNGAGLGSLLRYLLK